MRSPVMFVAGAAAGAYALYRARRAAELFTSEGLSDRFQGLRYGARAFREEVAQGQVDKEAELRDRLGLEVSGPLRITTGDAAEPAAVEPTAIGPAPHH